MRKYTYVRAYVRVKRAEKSRDGQMAPTPKREQHLDLWSSIFQAIWLGPPIISVVRRPFSRVFLPSVYFLNGRNNKLSQPPSCATSADRGWSAGRISIRTCKKRGGKPRTRSRNTRVPRVTIRHAIVLRNRAVLHRSVTVRFRLEMMDRNLVAAANSSTEVRNAIRLQPESTLSFRSWIPRASICRIILLKIVFEKFLQYARFPFEI